MCDLVVIQYMCVYVCVCVLLHSFIICGEAVMVVVVFLLVVVLKTRGECLILRYVAIYIHIIRIRIMVEQKRREEEKREEEKRKRKRKERTTD